MLNSRLNQGKSRPRAGQSRYSPKTALCLPVLPPFPPESLRQKSACFSPRHRPIRFARFDARTAYFSRSAEPLEHGLSGACHQCFACPLQGAGRYVAAISVPAGVGAYQPDRRLPMAQQCQGRCGEVQAIATAATGLACFIFRFLR